MSDTAAGLGTPRGLDESPPLVPGYTLHAVLGSGATSTVWGGVDAAGHAVAVKVARDAADAADRAQFEVERHVLSAIRHEHLAELRDVATLDDGRLALVFDRVTGAPLARLVGSRGHLRPGEVVTVLTPVCQAVAAVHAVGATHGDIAPGNVLLTATGRPVLLDLGGARLAGHGAGVVLGTPGFVAPEVREGDPPGTATDVFAIGALAWFCLTGNGAPDTHIRLDPETITSHVGRELAEVVGACIDPDPTRRPSAAELAGLLYDACPVEPVEVVLGCDEAAALTHRLRAEALEQPEPASLASHRRRRWVVGAVTTSATVALIVAGGWVLGSRAGAAPEAPTVSSSSPARPSVVTPPVPAAGATACLGPAARPTSGPTQLPTGLRKGPQVDLRADPEAPRRRAHDLMQRLSDLRCVALTDRDGAALRSVHQAGSPALAMDLALLDGLLRGGHRYVGLRLEVAEATWVTGSVSSATVRARVDWTDYTVVSRSGLRQTRHAEPGAVLDFSLVRGPEGWRIRRISPVGGSPAT